MADAERLKALERELAELRDRVDDDHVRQLAYPLFEAMDLPAILLHADGSLDRGNRVCLSRWPALVDDAGLRSMGVGLQAELLRMCEAATSRGRAIGEVSLDEDGTNLVLELGASLIPGPRGQVLVTLQDITAQVAIGEQLETARDEALRASRLKTQFVANMSHEIRTPLNGIVGMLELLRLTPLTAQQKHFVDTGRQSAKLLFQLIEDILDFSRIEAGRVALREADFDLQSVVSRALQPSAIAADAKGLELLVSYAPALPSHLRCDENRLAQVLVNLVGNAIKFTETGSILVRFSLGASEGHDKGVEPPDDGIVLEVSIRDTGPGVPAEYRETIFEQFTQVDGTLARRFGGSGLGLTICRNLVQLMGGRIWLNDAVEEGSDFRFCLPVSLTARPPQIDPSALRGARILIVDPNEASLSILVEMLNSWEMEVDACDEADAALRLLDRKAPYRFVLWDSRLPGSNSISEKLARAAPNCSLVMLAPSEVIEGSYAAEQGDHHIVKPVSPSDLLEQLIDCLAINERGVVDETRADVPARSSLNVLVVDDNAVNREVAQGMVESRGHRVWVASSGEEALSMLAERSFDCVLLDIQMPGLTGVEVVEHYARTEPRFPPKFIAMTAHAMVGDREGFLQSGFHDYIAKPMTLSGLADVLAPVEGAKSPDSEGKTEGLRTAAPFDEAGMLVRAGGRTDRAVRMCQIFAAELPVLLDKVRLALDERNHKALATACHALAGMVGNFGSPAEVVAREMERFAGAGAVDEAANLLPALEFESAKTSQALEDYVAAQQ